MKRFLKETEQIFRQSNSPDELFDAFQNAVELELKDLEIYKVLLANPYLSTDEIKLFTEKLSRMMPENSFNLFMWSASIFANTKDDPDRVDDAADYYKRASIQNPSEYSPLINLLGMYNFDFDLPANDMLINFVENRIPFITKKSPIFSALSQIYKRKGDLALAAKYLALAEKSAESE